MESLQNENKEFERLTIILEGGPHMVDYLLHNGVIANSFVLDAGKFKEILPYLDKGDDVLLIIKGLTDFTLSDIYALLGVFKQNVEKLGRITILSNIELGKVSMDYYLYTGDLFYGGVKKISNGKGVIDEEFGVDLEKSNPNEGFVGAFKKKNRGDKNKNKQDIINKNAVANAYKVYNSNNVKVQIYSKDKKPVGQINGKEEEVLQRVKNINLYAE